MSTSIYLKKGKTQLDLGSINQFKRHFNTGEIYEEGELDTYFINLLSTFKEDLFNLLIYRPRSESVFRERLNNLIDEFVDSSDQVSRTYLLNTLSKQVDKTERR